MNDIVLRPVGRVESPLQLRSEAPRQGDEGAPDAWIVVADEFAPALDGLEEGSDMLVLTWLDRGDRSVLTVRPRGDATRAEQGVFQTRSPDRPNPIGLHRVRVFGVEGTRIRVGDLEALDGTPVVDLKPVLGDVADR